MLKQGIKIEAQEALNIGIRLLNTSVDVQEPVLSRFYTRAGAAFRAIEKITRDR